MEINLTTKIAQKLSSLNSFLENSNLTNTPNSSKNQSRVSNKRNYILGNPSNLLRSIVSPSNTKKQKRFNCGSKKKLFYIQEVTNKNKPKTNFENIIEGINEIAEHFEELNDTKLFDKAIWIKKELLSHNIYGFEKKSNEENPDFDKFMANYFPINKIEYTREDEFDSDSDIATITRNTSKTNSKSSSDSNYVKPLDITRLGTSFDVMAYAKEIGRENMLSSIAKAVFYYKGLGSLIKNSKFGGYIEEIRIGYTMNKEAMYHNVRFLLVFIKPKFINFIYYFSFRIFTPLIFYKLCSIFA